MLTECSDTLTGKQAAAAYLDGETVEYRYTWDSPKTGWMFLGKSTGLGIFKEKNVVFRLRRELLTRVLSYEPGDSSNSYGLVIVAPVELLGKKFSVAFQELV
jgi:hypothetical protein